MSKSRLRSRGKGKVTIADNGPALSKLNELLASIASESDASKVEQSLSKMVQAATDYRITYSEIVDLDHRRRPSKNATSVALRDLAAQVESLTQDIRKLPLAALQLFCREYGPHGKLLRELKEAGGSIESALVKSTSTKDYAPDDERVYLAYVVGVELSKLNVRLSLSEFDGRITGVRNGAAWAKVVNQTLEVAGFQGAKIRKKQLKQAKVLMTEME